jgi:hypothetical protein
MANENGFQSIRRLDRIPGRDEDSLLEALAARKGVGRLQPTQDTRATPPETAEPEPDLPPAERPSRSRKEETPTPRSRMKAMNLELPDYVMKQLKTQALREDCSVRHLIMRSLQAQGISIRPPDMVADGRRNRGKG